MGSGRFRGHARFSPPQNRTAPPFDSPIGRVGIYATMVELLGRGRAVGSDRQHPGSGSAGVDPARRAAAGNGTRGRRYRTGAIAAFLSTWPGPSWGLGCGVGLLFGTVFFLFGVVFSVSASKVEEEEESGE